MASHDVQRKRAFTRGFLANDHGLAVDAMPYRREHLARSWRAGWRAREVKRGG